MKTVYLVIYKPSGSYRQSKVFYDSDEAQDYALKINEQKGCSVRVIYKKPNSKKWFLLNNLLPRECC